MKNIITLILLFSMGFFYTSNPCTVIYATDGENILGGNNEDWSDSNTKLWIIPPSEEKYGWIKFGFAGGFPQGGMNEKGVFWDGTGCPYIRMPYSKANKIRYDGPLMEKVIESCASVGEARTIFNSYFCEDQSQAQYLLGDAFGSSMLVEGDSLIVTTNLCQVAANFYHSHPELGGYPNKRYDTAYLMLFINKIKSVDLLRSILYNTHQNGRYPTQYSNIYDLKNKIIYLFHQHNFEEVYMINLSEELKKPAHSYYLRKIFSNIQVISPVAEDNQDPGEITFTWTGINLSRYEIYCSQDPEFREYSTFVVSLSPYRLPNQIVYVTSLMGIFLIGNIITRKRKPFLLFFIALMICATFSCDGEITSPQVKEIKEWSKTIHSLDPDTQYYWKIIAYPENLPDVSTTSQVHSFYTGK